MNEKILFFSFPFFSELHGQKLTINNEDDEYAEPHGPNIQQALPIHLQVFQYSQSLSTCFNNKFSIS